MYLERDVQVLSAELPISANGSFDLVTFDPGVGATVLEIRLRPPQGVLLIPGEFAVHFQVHGHDGMSSYQQQMTAVHNLQLSTGYFLGKIPILGDPIFQACRAVGNEAYPGKIVGVISTPHPMADKIAVVHFVVYPDDLN